jgi:hypothetical protein
VADIHAALAGSRQGPGGSVSARLRLAVIIAVLLAASGAFCLWRAMALASACRVESAFMTRSAE